MREERVLKRWWKSAHRSRLWQHGSRLCDADDSEEPGASAPYHGNKERKKSRRGRAAKRTKRRPFPPVCHDLEKRRMPTTFVVTNNNDSGPGSLVQASFDSNGTSGPNTIDFNIGSGHQTILPSISLPEITTTVDIDGTSQPGYAGTSLIEINNTHASGGTGLIFGADGSAMPQTRDPLFAASTTFAIHRQKPGAGPHRRDARHPTSGRFPRRSHLDIAQFFDLSANAPALTLGA